MEDDIPAGIDNSSYNSSSKYDFDIPPSKEAGLNPNSKMFLGPNSFLGKTPSAPSNGTRSLHNIETSSRGFPLAPSTNTLAKDGTGETNQDIFDLDVFDFAMTPTQLAELEAFREMNRSNPSAPSVGASTSMHRPNSSAEPLSSTVPGLNPILISAEASSLLNNNNQPSLLPAPNAPSSAANTNNTHGANAFVASSGLAQNLGRSPSVGSNEAISNSMSNMGAASYSGQNFQHELIKLMHQNPILAQRVQQNPSLVQQMQHNPMFAQQVIQHCQKQLQIHISRQQQHQMFQKQGQGLPENPRKSVPVHGNQAGTFQPQSGGASVGRGGLMAAHQQQIMMQKPHLQQQLQFQQQKFQQQFQQQQLQNQVHQQQFQPQIQFQQPQLNQRLHQGYTPIPQNKLQQQQRVQYLNTFENTTHAEMNQRINFEKAFASYTLNQKLPNPPIIGPGKTMLDVFVLFHMIMQLGGFEAVNLNNYWPGLCKSLNLEQTGNSQSMLHNYYKAALLNLEKILGKDSLVKPRPVIPAKRPSSDLGDAGSARQQPSPRLQMETTSNSDNMILAPNFDEKSSLKTNANFQVKPDVKVETDVKMDIKAESENSDAKGYLPKCRTLGSFGVSEVGTFFSLSSTQKPSCLDPRKYPIVNLALKSGLPMQVKYALDLMVLVSSRFEMDLKDTPELLSTLTELFQDTLQEIGSISDSFKSNTTKNNEFIKYSDLFEQDSKSRFMFRLHAGETLDPLAMNIDRLSALGVIFRNCACSSENTVIMASHAGLKQVVWKSLDLSEYWKLVPDEFTYTSNPLLLEHRKNAIIVLSYMGSLTLLPDMDVTNTVSRIILDFMTETSKTYSFAALDCLAHLINNPKNLEKIENCGLVGQLVQALLHKLPWTGISLAAKIYTADVAELELAMTCLTALITQRSAHDISNILELSPDIDRILYNCIRRPRCRSGDAMVYMVIRERALIILIHLVKNIFKASIRRDWEEELLLQGYTMLKEGEIWGSNLIFNNLIV